MVASSAAQVVHVQLSARIPHGPAPCSVQKALLNGCSGALTADVHQPGSRGLCSAGVTVHLGLVEQRGVRHAYDDRGDYRAGQTKTEARCTRTGRRC